MKNHDLAFLPASRSTIAAIGAAYRVRSDAPVTPGFTPAQAAKDNVVALHPFGTATRGHSEIDVQIRDYYLYLPPKLTPQQCARARAMLAWSREALAFRSGVSVKAIEQFESASRQLRDVTRQALAYALEAEGLLFFVGHEPVRSNGCPGPTLDPRQRDDGHLIE